MTDLPSSADPDDALAQPPRGLLDVLEPGASLSGFMPHDPDEADCEVHVDDLEAG